MSQDEIAARVEDISKCYRIGAKEQIDDTFGRTILNFLSNPLSNYRKYRSLYNFDDITPEHTDNGDSPPDVIWALRNVSFEVKRGEVIGIIGANGAGKSTLLKILSRITVPTYGQAVISGRISSLLEVGTGFHKELTGRENIYLNGTILGMRKKEVDAKYDEIVEFSGIEKFIDTPVKRYSSGMTVRLAFSVAAHLEPEILMIDEVLSVGDAAFQQKSLGKMQSVAGKGRTVFFVSHNMSAITMLCENVIWLEQGQVKLIGPAKEVVAKYLTSGTQNSAQWNAIHHDHDNQEVNIESVRITTEDGEPAEIVNFDTSFIIEIKYEVFRPLMNLSIVYRLADAMGNYVFESMDTDGRKFVEISRAPGRYVSQGIVPGHLLKPGRYTLSVLAYMKQIRIVQEHKNIITFDVSDINYHLTPNRRGFVTPVLDWNIVNID